MRKSVLSGKLQKYTPKTVVEAGRISRIVDASRRNGIFIADETYQTGTRTISAPIIDAVGTTIAAVTVAGPVQRVTPKMLAALGRPLRRTAEAVSARIVHSSSSMSK
jgi:DNA-binding IclR family transcriptional regulator